MSTVEEFIWNVSQGNPGAVNVCARILQTPSPHAELALLACQDHGLRGSRLWVAYKDLCGEDIERLIQRLCADPEPLVAGADAICGGPR